MIIFEKLSKQHIGLPTTLALLYISFLGSLIFEYYLKFEPSSLCLAQRYCTAACIMFVTVAFLARGQTQKKCIDFSCIALFWGFGISAYHLLIQYGFLSEPSMFKPSIPVNVTIDELNAIVEMSKAASCANLAPTVFSLPSSAFTCIMFVFLFIYLSLCFKTSTTETETLTASKD